jgi:hypothetical protein
MGKAKPALNGETRFGECTLKKAESALAPRAFNNCSLSGSRMQRIDQALSMAANGSDGGSPAPRGAAYCSIALRELRVDAMTPSCSSLPKRCGGSRQSALSLTRFSRCTSANVEAALDEVFADLPHGGDHESRKYVAERLLRSARKGNVTLEGLRVAGRNAFRQLSTQRFADAISVISKSISSDQPVSR